MSDNLKDLELRLRRVEAYMEITNLLARYGRCLDGGWDRNSHNYNRVVEEVFSPTATWEADGYPTATGTEALREMFKSFADIQYASHMLLMPLIKFNDDVTEAIGMIDLIGAGRNNLFQSSFACFGYYSMKFRLTEKGWRIEHLINRNHVFNPNWTGWNWDNRIGPDLYPDFWGEDGPDHIKVNTTDSVPTY